MSKYIFNELLNFLEEAIIKNTSNIIIREAKTAKEIIIGFFNGKFILKCAGAVRSVPVPHSHYTVPYRTVPYLHGPAPAIVGAGP